MLWLQALFHRGAVTVDHYSGGLTGSSLDLPRPPTAIEQEFRNALRQAILLADARAKARPQDADALYDLGSAYGLEASWTASIDGRVRAAFGSARKAFDAQERVLEIDPRRVEAGAIVGTYKYVVAGLGFASRMVAYVAGFSSGKAEGIRMLEAAGAPGSSSRFEARTALVLIYSREGRHEDAYRLLTAMSAEFPDNRVLVMERGSAAIRAGRAREGEQILRAGLERLQSDTRRRLPGEESVWHYRIGLARLALNRSTLATESLTTALALSPELWVRARIELTLGKAADLEGRRSDAVAWYRRAVESARTGRDRPTQQEAQRLMRRPFVLARIGPALPDRAAVWHEIEAVLV
jgi:hypothetical protein